MIQKSHTWVYIQKRQEIIWKDTCTTMFLAVLFAVAKTWRPSKCSWTEEYIKMWKYICIYIYNGILLRHEKEWNIDICSNMDRQWSEHRWATTFGHTGEGSQMVDSGNHMWKSPLTWASKEWDFRTRQEQWSPSPFQAQWKSRKGERKPHHWKAPGVREAGFRGENQILGKVREQRRIYWWRLGIRMRVGEGTRNWEGMILGPTRKDITMSSWAIKDRPGVPTLLMDEDVEWCLEHSSCLINAV